MVRPHTSHAPSPLWGAVSEKTSARPRNEDRYLLRPDTELVGIADGLGGHGDGDVASHIAAEETLAWAGERPVESLHALEAAARELRRRIVRRYENAVLQDGSSPDLGSTLSFALRLASGAFGVFHLGDSWIFRVRSSGRVEPWTLPQNEAFRALRRGRFTFAEAFARSGHLVEGCCSLLPDHWRPEVHTFVADPGDVLVSASDGLEHYGDWADLESLLRGFAGTLPEALDRIRAFALSDRARDNVTVAALRLGPGQAEPG